jgi:hypothetical protein
MIENIWWLHRLNSGPYFQIEILSGSFRDGLKNGERHQAPRKPVVQVIALITRGG